MIQPSLRATLRDDTAAAHDRVDALVGGGFTDAAGYRRYLRGMRRFLHASEPVLAPAWPMAPLLAWLQADLQAPQADVAATRPGATPSGDEAAWLGYAYVVGGAAVGARQLLRDARGLGFGPGEGADFLHGFAHGRMWPDVLERLQAARFDPDQTLRCRAAAQAAFAAAEAAFAQETLDG